ncbi:MFS transporter [Noviherbaspirillum sedimenti]|uniref:MFS transporter n=1 Tax=Noviherbaspirillum sedimenti TaxID=2320865 RepID=A0A3A3G7L7_9BURK|nr:MFS transporter [Noviherbaspirillum sedimenti]RJG04507.1 MFS transporter [Noviherbaspirillum sedimenti]
MAPLRQPVFRMLWLAWLAANMTMWMNEVASAWLMTSLTENAFMVAMVQAASTLPVFLLGLPSGALADIVDRRRYFALTQVWAGLVAILLAALAFADALTAPLLLVLTFANGITMAMRWPVFAAIVPELVPRHDLPAALALNGIAANMSRVIGPVIAGALLAGAGSAYVFLLNAALSVIAFVLILRWRSEPKISALPGERFFAAMRVGLQHVKQSPRMRTVLVRTFLFFLQATSLTALLPLIARRMEDGGPGAFTLLLAAMGTGALIMALNLTRLRRHIERDTMVYWGTCVHAVAAVATVLSPNLWFAVPAMAVAGMAWIGTANSMTVSAQLALPDWVRARGMSIYQMALMGGGAAGAALWGYVAHLSSVPTSIIAAAVLGPMMLLLTKRQGAGGIVDEDLTPAAPTGAAPPPVIDIEPNEGPVMVAIEYLIAPENARTFNAVMHETRLARLRQGALSWGLFRDISQAGRYIEYFLDENWIEHQRRLEHFTAADLELRNRRLAFHIGEEPPRTRRYIGETIRGFGAAPRR